MEVTGYTIVFVNLRLTWWTTSLSTMLILTKMERLEGMACGVQAPLGTTMQHFVQSMTRVELLGMIIGLFLKMGCIPMRLCLVGHI